MIDTPTITPGRPKDPIKRQAILQASKLLFLSLGYAGTSMDAIAAEAGVSKLTVYSHFTDKETLFAAAIHSKCAEQLPQLFFSLQAGQPLERVLFNIAMGFQGLINSPEAIDLQRVIMSLSGQDPTFAGMFFEAGPLVILNDMQQLLETAHHAGLLSVTKPRNAAQHFFALVKGDRHYRLLLGCGSLEDVTQAQIEEHVHEVVQLFMRAYRP